MRLLSKYAPLLLRIRADLMTPMHHRQGPKWAHVRLFHALPSSRVEHLKRLRRFRRVILTNLTTGPVLAS